MAGPRLVWLLDRIIEEPPDTMSLTLPAASVPHSTRLTWLLKIYYVDRWRTSRAIASTKTALNLSLFSTLIKKLEFYILLRKIFQKDVEISSKRQ